MPHRIAIIALILGIFGCDSERREVVEAEKESVRSLVQIGDNIYDVKAKLEAEGFRISYGPDYPTKTRKYLMMIVDYGVIPNGEEAFRYTVGIEGDDELIDGIIKADTEGVITSIE